MLAITMKCKIDEIIDDKAYCWAGLSKLFRVRISISLDKLSHLNLSVGDEFEWDHDNQVASLITVESQETERKKLQELIGELKRKYETKKEEGYKTIGG